MKKIAILLASSAIGAIANVFDNDATNIPHDEILETVTVIRDHGPVRINKSDYNPETDVLAEGEESPAPLRDAAAIAAETKAAAPAAAPAAPETPAPTPAAPAAPAPAADPAALAAPTTDSGEPKPVLPGIMQDGAKWFVVDMNADNAKIADTNGYPSKKKADEAAVALTPPAPAA